jgi:hypothetical protein
LKTGKSRPHLAPYLVLNRVFAGIILLIILYSVLYSLEKERYPIPSGSQFFSGNRTISTGLSHSFSAVVRFDFQAAEKYNPYGIRIFIFFAVQLLMRLAGIFLSVRIRERNLIVLFLADAMLSISFFLYAFWPFFSAVIQGCSFQLSAVSYQLSALSGQLSALSGQR